MRELITSAISRLLIIRNYKSSGGDKKSSPFFYRKNLLLQIFLCKRKKYVLTNFKKNFIKKAVALMAELVDAQVSGTCDRLWSWKFKSSSGHQITPCKRGYLVSKGKKI